MTAVVPAIVVKMIAGCDLESGSESEVGEFGSELVLFPLPFPFPSPELDPWPEPEPEPPPPLDPDEDLEYGFRLC